MFVMNNGFNGMYLRGNEWAGFLCPSQMALNSQVVFNDFGRAALGLEHYDRLGLLYFPAVIGLTAVFYLLGRKVFGKRVMN